MLQNISATIIQWCPNQDHLSEKQRCFFNMIILYMWQILTNIQEQYKVKKRKKGNLKDLRSISLCGCILLSKPTSILSHLLLLLHPHQDLSATKTHITQEKTYVNPRMNTNRQNETWSIAVSCSCLSASACRSWATSSSSCSTWRW